MPKLNPELHREIQAYLDEMHATKTERAYVWRWVHDGHDFLSNGWYYAFEGGILMDPQSRISCTQNQITLEKATLTIAEMPAISEERLDF